MPITPLHFGVLSPINHVKPRKVSWVTFALVNIWIDLPAFFEVALGIPAGEPIHGPATHSFMAAFLAATFVAVCFIFSKRRLAYIYGAYIGGFSHIVLDMFCHPEMQPFYPLSETNHFYMGWLTPMSYVLMPFFVWWLYQEYSFYRPRFLRDEH